MMWVGERAGHLLHPNLEGILTYRMSYESGESGSRRARFAETRRRNRLPFFTIKPPLDRQKSHVGPCHLHPSPQTRCGAPSPHSVSRNGSAAAPARAAARGRERRRVPSGFHRPGQLGGEHRPRRRGVGRPPGQRHPHRPPPPPRARHGLRLHRRLPARHQCPGFTSSSFPLCCSGPLDSVRIPKSSQ